MSKHTLDFEYDFNFMVFAIACHESAYKTCHAINQTFGIELMMEAAIELKNKKQSENLLFNYYSCDDEETYLIYDLVENKSYNTVKLENKTNNSLSLFDTDDEINEQIGYLIPELNEFQFLFIVRDEPDEDKIESYLEKINQIDFVLNIQAIEVNELTNKKNLIF